MKSIVRQWPEGSITTWVPGVLRWVHVENVGGVLGLMGGWPAQIRLALFVFAALGAAVLACMWLRRASPSAWWTPACLGLVVGGTIGNSVDRAVRGAVTDVVVVGEAIFGPLLGILPFVDGVPAFNAADVWLGLGLIGLAVAVASRIVDVRRGRDTALDPPHPPG